MASINYYIDFKSPAAYLSLKPTLNMARAHELEISFFPYDTRQKEIPIIQENESKGETHIRVREIARRQMHLKYAKLQNTPMAFPPKISETKLALAALLYMEQDPLPFIEAAFSAYWHEHLDLNQYQTVETLLERHGYDISGFDPEICLSQLAAHQLAAEEIGVIDTPCYIAEQQLFIGREHLPWIEDIFSSAI